MAKSRSLNFIFGGDATKFHKTIGNIRKGVGAAAKYTVAAGAAAAAAGAAAWAKALTGTAKYADEIGKTAAKTGISTAELQRLQMAAELSGAQLSDLSSTTLRMQKAVGDLGEGTKEQVDAFAQLGLGFDDLAGKSPEEQLLKIMRAVAEVGDVSKRNDLAQTILGKGGASLLPMLENGADGLDQLRKARERAGPLLSDEQINSAEAFNDSITKLKTSAQANIFAGLAGAFPELTNIIENFVSQNNFQKITPAIQEFSSAMVDIVGKIAELAQDEDTVAGLVAAFDGMGEAATAAAEAVGALLAKYNELSDFMGDKAETFAEVAAAGSEKLQRAKQGEGSLKDITYSNIILDKIYTALVEGLPE